MSKKLNEISCIMSHHLFFPLSLFWLFLFILCLNLKFVAHHSTGARCMHGALKRQVAFHCIVAVYSHIDEMQFFLVVVLKLLADGV